MRLLVVALAVAAVLAPRRANAECAPPRTSFMPDADTVLPARPTIHVDVPHALGGGKFTAGHVPLAVEQISSDRVSDGFAIHLLVDDGYVTVRYDRGDVHVHETYAVRGARPSHVAQSYRSRTSRTASART